MDRLTPENCKELQKLGLPVNIANGSFFKPERAIGYCYCSIPYILNKHSCIPCWSLNDLLEYLKKENGNEKLILLFENNTWNINLFKYNITKSGISALEVVYNITIEVLKIKNKDTESSN